MRHRRPFLALVLIAALSILVPSLGVAEHAQPLNCVVHICSTNGFEYQCCPGPGYLACLCASCPADWGCD